MDALTEFQSALGAAARAGAAGSLAEAGRALADARPLLDPLRDECGRLAMHLELQAANFAQMTEQMPLALEYASRAISEASAFIEEALNRPPRSIPDETVRLASLYAVAFIPWVWRHPGIQTGALANDAEWQGLTFLLQHVRPSLDQAGWAHWEFPADLAAKARHAGARALTDYGRMSMRGARSGEDIRSAQTLGEEALVLVQDLPPDQLTADAHNLLARCFFAYDDLDALRDQAIPHMEKSIKILDSADGACWLACTLREFYEHTDPQLPSDKRRTANELIANQNAHFDIAVANISPHNIWNIIPTQKHDWVLTRHNPRLDEFSIGEYHLLRGTYFKVA